MVPGTSVPGGGGWHGGSFRRAVEFITVEGTVGSLDLEHRGGAHSLVTWASPIAISRAPRCSFWPPPRFLEILGVIAEGFLWKSKSSSIYRP